jgi:hypothetical protein
MDSTTSGQPFFGAEALLSEPHFDEEATVLSARPVVPLATIEAARVKAFPRPWLLGSALVGALLVGIFATAIYYSSFRRDEAALFNDAEIAASAEVSLPLTEESPSGPVVDRATVRVGARSEDAAATSPATSQAFEPAAASFKRPVARRVAVVTEKPGSNQANEGSRADRRAARKQARQERRQADREKRDPRPADGLLRIRDLFEGSPQP